MEKTGKNFYSYFYRVPSEIVHQALISLSDAECGFILKAHNGSLLNGLKTLSPNEKKKYYDILYVINRNISKINNKNKQKKKNKTLFERFPDYDINQIKRAFGCLNTKYQMILVKAYGEDLSLPFDKEKLTADERKCLSNIYAALKNKLSNPNFSRKRINDYNLYDRFPEYSVSEINGVINGLTLKQKELLAQIYPNGLENKGQALKKSSDKSKVSALFRIIRENLERNKQQSNNEKVAETVKVKKNIYEKFSAYEQTAVKAVFDTLSVSQQDVLRKVYGERLTEPFENNNLSKQEKKTLSVTFNIIESKLKAGYKKKRQGTFKTDTSELQQKTASSPKANKEVKRRGARPKSLVVLYSNYDLETIKKVVNKLKEEKQQLLFRAYGTNLDKPKDVTGFTETEIKQLNNIVYQTLKKSLLSTKSANNTKKVRSIPVGDKGKPKEILTMYSETEPDETNELSIDMKEECDLVQARSKRKSRESCVTNNIERDFLLKLPPYKKISRAKEKRILKIIKMSFYDEVTPEQQELYIKYFGDEYPWFKEKMSLDISEEERDRLIKKVIDIALNARDEFIKKNIRLVYKCAYHFKNYKVPIIDLIQEGTIGMMKAIKKFDVERNVNFSTYAMWWIRQGMEHYADNNIRTIRIPTHRIDFINKMRKVEEALIKKFGSEPTNEQLADALGVSIENIEKAKIENIPPTSLDKPIGDDNDDVLGDFITDKKSDFTEEVHNKIEKEQIFDILVNSGLSEREIKIIVMRFGLDGNGPKTLEVVGKVFGVTRERIRQIEVVALKTLRSNIQIKEIYEEYEDSSISTKKIRMKK